MPTAEPSEPPLADLPSEEALRAYLRTAPLVGSAYFSAVVEELSQCLGCLYAFVCEWADPDKKQVRLVESWPPGMQYLPPVYNISNTPCEEVLRTGILTHESGLRSIYPHNAFLESMGAECYYGIRLTDSKNQHIGFISAVHDRPIPLTANIRNTLTLFASRTGVELERLQANSRIARNEARYRSVFDSLGEGILIYHRNGTLLNCNPSACSILGVEENLLRQLRYDDPSWKVFDTSGQEVLPGDYPVQVCLRTGQSVCGRVYGVRTPQGNMRWLNIFAAPVFEPDSDAFNLVTLSFTDTTEQRQSESALRLSEERFRTLIQHSPDAIVVIDAETMKFVDHNPQAQKLFLMSGHELSQCGPIDVSPEFQPDGMPSADKAAVVIQSAARGKNIIFEWLLRRKTGENILCEFRLIRLPSPDRTLLRGSITDVTERRRSQERFRVMAEQTGQLVYEYDIQSEEIVWSGAIYRVTGYPPEDFQSTNVVRWTESIHPDDREHATSVLEHVIRHGTRYDVAYRFRRRDDTWIHIEDHGVVIRDETGRPTIMLGTMSDVTEQKKREEATRMLENQLRQSQKMEAVGTLAGGIAHDFNNILGAIIGYTELAAMECPDNSGVRPLLDEAVKASLRAKDLVRQILTFSRRQQPVRVPLKLADCIQESVRLLRATLPVSIKLITRLESHPRILGDSSQIQQVLINLATNAAHAMQDKPGVLTLSLRLCEVESHRPANILPGLQAGPYALLEVQDNGQGMESDTLKRIFEPFFTTKKPGEGTGLGLAVVHGIINDHNGIIEVESTPGCGTTFHIYIPASEVEEPATPSPTFQMHSGRGQRILVVDDEFDLTQVVQKILERLGYVPVVFNNPLEALACLQEDPGKIDLILADLSMPEMTGIELAHAVRVLRPELPLLLITGYGGDWTDAKAAEFGIRAIVSKPVSFRQLAELIHTHILHP